MIHVQSYLLQFGVEKIKYNLMSFNKTYKSPKILNISSCLLIDNSYRSTNKLTRLHFRTFSKEYNLNQLLYLSFPQCD